MRGRAALLLVLLALLALALHQRERVAGLGAAFLGAYVDAQATMLRASGNVTEDGRSEFAVLLADGATAQSLRAELAAIPDVTFAREADLDGWVIVHTAAGNRSALNAVLALSEARVVVPNRGLWICH